MTARATRIVACAVAFLLPACGVDEESVQGERAASLRIIVHDDPSLPAYGAVDVQPVDMDALSRFQRSKPQLEDWQRVFAVFAGDSNRTTGPTLPVLGSYLIAEDLLRFRPRFLPVPGQPYTARYNSAALADRVGGKVRPETLDTVFVIRRDSAAVGSFVQTVYPTADVLPMNLLRLYVHFSAPMSVGEAAKRVRLVAQDGKTVEDAFLMIPQQQELWDPERRRLTLLLDPGRIKRDLRPHEELGLALREGGEYSLVIDSAWKDARGNPLASGFAKRFRAGPADRSLPQTNDWRVQSPRSGTLAPLVVVFPKSFDRALLERLVAVKQADGGVVAGSVDIDQNETRWQFTPRVPWQAGSYFIEVSTALEDLAGNNLRDLFDVDRKAAQTPGATGDHVRIPFSVAG